MAGALPVCKTLNWRPNWAGYRRRRNTMALRRIARIVTPGPPAPGFIGDGHLAVMVVSPDEFPSNDPFILLADDRLDLREGQPAGGPHPHAGFETVTLMLEASLHDRDEGVAEGRAV